MWIMTPHGFVSIVEKPEDRGNDTLTVRARDEKSLVAFCEAAGYEVEGYDVNMATDYPFRDTFTREEVDQAVLTMVADITYSNFKTEAKRVRGHVYASALGRVWTDMLALTPGSVYKQMRKQWRKEDEAAVDVPPFIDPDPDDDAPAKDVGDMTEDEWMAYLAEQFGEEIT